MRFGSGLCQAARLCVFLLMLGVVVVPVPVSAGPDVPDPCATAKGADLKRQRVESLRKRWDEIDSNWQDPNSFDNMFCGGALTNAFANLLSPFSLDSLLSSIMSSIRSQLSQICQQTLSLRPISLPGLTSGLSSAVCPNFSNSCSLLGLENYIAIIQKVDPNYWSRLTSSASFADPCYLQRMIVQWLNANPQYLNRFCPTPPSNPRSPFTR